MADVKIVIEPLDSNALAELQKSKTFNQQIHDALKGVEVGSGFAVEVPADKTRQKVIQAFPSFIDKKEVRATMTAHKTAPTKVVVTRTA